MSRSDISTDVLVVGAGPTGLMLANWLRRLNIDAVIVDSKSGPTRESRALGVQARSMEIYDQLGIVDKVLAGAQPALAVSPGYAKKSFGRVEFGAIGGRVSPFPRLYILEQSLNEQILLENLLLLGGEVRWNHRLTALQTRDGVAPAGVAADGAARPVRATLSGPDGGLTVTARYCVGADGSSSAVRGLRGIEFEGVTNRHTFYVADAVGVRGLSEDTVNLRFGNREFLISFPMGEDGRMRLIGAVPTAELGEGAEVREAALRPLLRDVFGVGYTSLRWFSSYRVHHRVAARFRDGPFFLAGDAAHVHSPVGAQGMNTGLQDAHNLAFKLAEVLRGGATEASLERYQAERRPVALRLVSTTDRLFGLVTSTRPAARLFRRVLPRIVAPLAVRVLPRLSGSARFFEYLSQTRVHYWMSDEDKKAADGRRGAVVGRRLPWAGSNFAALKSLRWQIHAYGDTDAAAARRLSTGFGVELHIFPSARGTRLEPGRFYLVRPDGFVAAEAPGDVADAAFRRFLPLAGPDAG